MYAFAYPDPPNANDIKAKVLQELSKSTNSDGKDNWEQLLSAGNVSLCISTNVAILS